MQFEHHVELLNVKHGINRLFFFFPKRRVFTALYALSPYIKEKRFVIKGVITAANVSYVLAFLHHSAYRNYYRARMTNLFTNWRHIYVKDHMKVLFRVVSVHLVVFFEVFQPVAIMSHIPTVHSPY
jgi:hypothetical protein